MEQPMTSVYGEPIPYQMRPGPLVVTNGFINICNKLPKINR